MNEDNSKLLQDPKSVKARAYHKAYREKHRDRLRVYNAGKKREERGRLSGFHSAEAGENSDRKDHGNMEDGVKQTHGED